MEPRDPRHPDRGTIWAALVEARERTLALIEPLTDEDLHRQHDPLMSPIVWDLGHIAHFEEVWLLENLEGGGGGEEGLRGIYDPFTNPRSVRNDLPLPTRAECLDYLRAVRSAVERKLDAIDLTSDSSLIRGGFGFNLVLQHEYQHNETILQTLQLKGGAPYPPARRAISRAIHRSSEKAEAETGMAYFPGGDVDIGTDDRSHAYDNERPRHRTRVDSFYIDRAPVTNGQFAEFMDAGGYRDPSPWSPVGRAWLESGDVEAPKFWTRRDGTWWTRVMGHDAPVDLRRPVCHVCFYEAEAFARWAGKRLPTEIEWEVAAGWHEADGRSRPYPWGHEAPDGSRANIDAGAFQPMPPGSFTGNVSPIGCRAMIGDVWEWTSSDFQPYPGYRTFPYPEYSEVFFGDEYKVLRGGSWATRPGAIRNTFRNWDYPIRRQIFSGFRCAKDG